MLANIFQHHGACGNSFVDSNPNIFRKYTVSSWFQKSTYHIFPRPNWFNLRSTIINHTSKVCRPYLHFRDTLPRTPKWSFPKKKGYPKSSILMGLSIKNHLFISIYGVPPAYGNPQMLLFLGEDSPPPPLRPASVKVRFSFTGECHAEATTWSDRALRTEAASGSAVQGLNFTQYLVVHPTNRKWVSSPQLCLWTTYPHKHPIEFTRLWAPTYFIRG